jgi:hypothetical protein
MRLLCRRSTGQYPVFPVDWQLNFQSAGDRGHDSDIRTGGQSIEIDPLRALVRRFSKNLLARRKGV